MSIIGLLPAPGKPRGAADVLGQAAFAYGAGSSVVVLEVQQFHIACTLHGGHRAPVTAVKWCPAHHSRVFKEQSHLRLASGDSDGGVLVWDVLTASPIARLQDVPAAREILREYAAKVTSMDATITTGGNAAAGSAAATGVASLAWVLPGSQTLAVVLSPALLLLWDVTSGAVLWRRELSTFMSEWFGHLAVAPSDSRQLCLCGSSGALVVLQLIDPANDKVKVQQYRVNLQDGNTNKAQESRSSSSSGTLQALFAVSPGLLLLLLPRELVVFDLELGQPAASTSLPPGRPVLSHLLGVFGSGVCQGGGDEGGLDFAYCTHVDGSLSVFVRRGVTLLQQMLQLRQVFDGRVLQVPGELRFKLGSNTRLVPPPVKGASNQVSLTVVKACLWQQHQQGMKAAQTASSTAAITQQLSASLAAMQITREGPPASGAAEARSGSSVGPTNSSSATTLSSHSLLVLAVTSDGRAWQWQVVLPQYPRRSFLTNSDTQPITAINATLQAARAAAAPTTVSPQLVGLLHGLPGSITATAFQQQPLMLACHSKDMIANYRTPTTLPGLAHLIDLGGPQEGTHSSSATDSDHPEHHKDSRDANTTADSPAAAECVVLGAAATSTGHIEVFSLRRGLVNPVSVEICWSQAVHRDAVHGVRWLGSLPLLLSFSSEKAGVGLWKNTLMLTDVRTGQSVPFRNHVGSESNPMLGVRVSPSGIYLLLLLKDAPCELWTTVPKQDTAAAGQQSCASIPQPWRVRLLDLPFSAVEWVAPGDDASQVVNTWAGLADGADQETTTAGTAGAGTAGVHWSQSPPQPPSAERQQSTVSFTRTLSALTSPSMSVAGDAALDYTMPTELLAFGLRDGRAGVLSVRGRKVTDTRPRRPSNSPAPGDSVASAVAAVGRLLVLGDADGTLLAWDTATGTCSALATGCGVVRRFQLAQSSSSNCLRLAVLFTGGQFGVFEVEATGRIRQTAASPAACARLGKALDVSWVTMPGQLGCSSILSVVLEDGSLCIADVSSSPANQPSPKARRAALQQALSTPSTARCNWVLSGGGVAVDAVTVVLLSPEPLGSSVLLRQPWVMLLRYLVQAGVSQDALLYMSSSSTEEDEDISRELMMMMPRPARATLAHIAAQAKQQRSSSESLLTGINQAPAAADVGHNSSQPAPEVAKAKSSALLRSSTALSQAGAMMQSSSARSLTDNSQQQQGKLAKLAAQGGNRSTTGFDGDLVMLLRRVAKFRGSGQLLHADEWKAYSEALASGLVARRMAVAAAITGHQDEARFWSHLPATLTAVKALQSAIQIKQQQQAAAAGTSGTAGSGCTPESTTPKSDTQQSLGGDEPDIDTVSDYDRMVQQAVQGTAADGNPLSRKSGSPAAGSPLSRRGSVPGRVRCSSGPEQLMSGGAGGAIKVAAAGRPVRLWDDELVLSDAQERLLWHEALPGQVFESEGMLEHRLLEYVVLGDFATAVAFLLSAPPESSVSYYRSVVCALALAATASLRAQSSGSNKSMHAAATLHLQAAKVVSAHAASIGDNLLGVPLNCSAGLDADAVTLLQEAGMWRHAAVLTARALSGTERAQALSHWSNHVLRHEGSVWRCVGILATAGCLSAAAQVLRAADLPDAAHAFMQACQQAGLLVNATDAAQQPQQGTSAQQQLLANIASNRDDTGQIRQTVSDDQCDEQLEPQQPDLMLFDLLGQRVRMLSVSSHNLFDSDTAMLNTASGNKPMTGPEELASITTGYHQYLCQLLSSL